MMKGIGIDLVDITRFNSWTTLSKRQLLRVFSEQELTYAFANRCKTVERLAVRFAAKEAFYKAISPLVHQQVPFLTVCRAVHVVNGRFPYLNVAWKMIKKHLDTDGQESITCLLSLTHTHTTASAVVFIQV